MTFTVPFATGAPRLVLETNADDRRSKVLLQNVAAAARRFQTLGRVYGLLGFTVPAVVTGRLMNQRLMGRLLIVGCERSLQVVQRCELSPHLPVMDPAYAWRLIRGVSGWGAPGDHAGRC